MKKFIKLIISNLFFYSGILYLVRFWSNFRGKRLIILTFHRVNKNGTNPQSCGLPTISISQDNFESLMNFIKRNYRVVSSQDYFKNAERRSALEPNSMMLSFDDCYEEVIENALPVLKRYHLPAIFFVPTQAIDAAGYFWWDLFYWLITNENAIKISAVNREDGATQQLLDEINSIILAPSCDKIRQMSKFIETLQEAPQPIQMNVIRHISDLYKKYNPNQNSIPRVMQWDDIIKLHSEGFEIGSHTVSHQFLSTLSEEEVVYELVASKKKLEEKLGNEIKCFSYPGGKHNDKTVELVKQSGYECAFTTHRGLNSSDTNPYRLKRVNVWDGTVTDFKGKFSKALTAWHLFFQ